MTNLLLRFAFTGSEWILWLLLLISFVSVGIIVDRLLYFHRNKVDAIELAAELDRLLQAGDWNGAWRLVSESNAIECVVLEAGIRAAARGGNACSEAMLAAKTRMRGFVDAKLAILATIGSNAPFIGLLGTVLGIIKAAHDLTSEAGSSDPNAVMGGVFEALIATAFGLAVAIPAVVAFNFLQRKVRSTMSQVDSLAHHFLATVNLDRQPGSPAPAVKR